MEAGATVHKVWNAQGGALHNLMPKPFMPCIHGEQMYPACAGSSLACLHSSSCWWHWTADICTHGDVARASGFGSLLLGDYLHTCLTFGRYVKPVDFGGI